MAVTISDADLQAIADKCVDIAANGVASYDDGAVKVTFAKPAELAAAQATLARTSASGPEFGSIVSPDYC